MAREECVSGERLKMHSKASNRLFVSLPKAGFPKLKKAFIKGWKGIYFTFAMNPTIQSLKELSRQPNCFPTKYYKQKAGFCASGCSSVSTTDMVGGVSSTSCNLQLVNTAVFQPGPGATSQDPDDGFQKWSKKMSIFLNGVFFKH